MVRPRKPSLEYFPMDCVNDTNVTIVHAKYGAEGFAAYVIFLQKIYGRRGYYLEWNEDILALLAMETMIEADTLEKILSELIKKEIFDYDIFAEYSVLTSKHIQKTYIEATGKRTNVSMKSEYLLIEKELLPSNVKPEGVTADISSEKAAETPQRKEKERKEKERKEKESKEKHSKAQKTNGGEVEVITSDVDTEIGESNSSVESDACADGDDVILNSHSFLTDEVNTAVEMTVGTDGAASARAESDDIKYAGQAACADGDDVILNSHSFLTDEVNTAVDMTVGTDGAASARAESDDIKYVRRDACADGGVLRSRSLNGDMRSAESVTRLDRSMMLPDSGEGAAEAVITAVVSAETDEYAHPDAEWSPDRNESDSGRRDDGYIPAGNEEYYDAESGFDGEDDEYDGYESEDYETEDEECMRLADEYYRQKYSGRKNEYLTPDDGFSYEDGDISPVGEYGGNDDQGRQGSVSDESLRQAAGNAPGRGERIIKEESAVITADAAEGAQGGFEAEGRRKGTVSGGSNEIAAEERDAESDIPRFTVNDDPVIPPTNIPSIGEVIEYMIKNKLDYVDYNKFYSVHTQCGTWGKMKSWQKELERYNYENMIAVKSKMRESSR